MSSDNYKHRVDFNLYDHILRLTMIVIYVCTCRSLQLLLALFPLAISFSGMPTRSYSRVHGNSENGFSLRSAPTEPHTRSSQYGSTLPVATTGSATTGITWTDKEYDSRESADSVWNDHLSKSVRPCWLLDVASITSSSNYPWTIESLAASAPLICNEDELVVLVVESTDNCFYSDGPLPLGVGIWFTPNSTEQLVVGSQDDDVWNVVSTNPCLLQTVSPALVLSDLETMGPRTTLPFPGTNSVTVQSYMDLQAEIQELRDILQPHHTKRRRPGVRKGISRKQRTKVQKRAILLETKSEAAKERKGYNAAADAAIFRHRLDECSACQIHNITSGLSEIHTLVREHQVRGDGAQAKHNHHRAIQGSALSEQVLTITRRSNISTSLRMVVLSDTHGYESQFQKYGNETSGSYLKLPDADILIHCGDFDGPGRSLDCFLSAQSHIRTQIVVRGNHDPVQYSFASGAQYITRRQTVTLDDGTVLEARPFVRSRKLPQAPLPDGCDILVTHEPPFGICDRTYRNERVGSLTLRHAVESSLYLPPAVWLCGHIHEGRGAVWHSFGSGSGLHSAAAAAAASTVVVNAANANAGKAKRVTTGPIVLDLVPKDGRQGPEHV